MRLAPVCALAIALVAGAAGCSDDPPPQPLAAARAHARPGRFTTIVFQAPKGKQVEYVAPGSAATEITTKAGVVDEGDSAAIEKLRKQAEDAHDQTLLVVTHTLGSAKKAALYLITTGRGIAAAVNGIALGAPDRHELLVTTPAGVDSTIVLADGEADATPFIATTSSLLPDTFYNHLTSSKHSQLDLDSGVVYKSGTAGAKQAADINMTTLGKLLAANGAQAAEWKSPLDPTPITCESLPPGSWKDTLRSAGDTLSMGAKAATGQGVVHKTWCVRSNEGRYGTVRDVDSNEGVALQYILWRKPSDSPPLAPGSASPQASG